MRQKTSLSSSVKGIANDITNRKKMEEQSDYIAKITLLETLAAGVAHEINNPLAIILGFTDILLEKTSPDSQSYDILNLLK